MKKNPRVSIIIVDYKKHNPLLVDCLENVTKQSYKNFETILLTDYPVGLRFPGLRKRSYGRYVGPAIKRDDGAKMARGEILAFIDDDAFPEKDWLREVVRTFANSRVAAVGGPGVTPPGAPWQEQLSGWFSASPVGGGPFAYRFLPERKKTVDDFPAMNLSVRRADFLAVGGFDSNYWPGEDTKLCLDLVYKLKKKIIYNPKAIVYHHRRPLFLKHFRQNGNYGVHRGYFARILPETSFRLEYFGPSLLLAGLLYISFYRLAEIIVSLNRFWMLSVVYSLGIVLVAFYCLAVVWNGWWIARRSGNMWFGVISVPVTLMTIMWYGVKFIQGFLSPRKVENSNQREWEKRGGLI